MTEGVNMNGQREMLRYDGVENISGARMALRLRRWMTCEPSDKDHGILKRMPIRYADEDAMKLV